MAWSERTDQNRSHVQLAMQIEQQPEMIERHFLNVRIL